MKSIRLGVFGAGRGLYLAECCKALGAEIVALCEGHKERREAAMAKLDPSVTAYESLRLAALRGCRRRSCHWQKSQFPHQEFGRASVLIFLEWYYLNYSAFANHGNEYRHS